MRRNGLEIKDGDVIISDRRFEDAGYFAMDEMLERDDRPTALFAAYSHIALGIMQRLKEEGMDVPRDLSLICMDDIQATQYSDKNLSSIKMHLDELSHSAVEMLYKKMESGGQSPRFEMTVIREFDVGQTVGKI
jgi:LacI family transcriptional regulator